ncbi:helix-turn-helix domain-containing protein [Candidatus Bathyarchaeota archaeon]|nr:helix-turn-helix domain-containing protein [Candidatus Bathyarchaeota archaeon]
MVGLWNNPCHAVIEVENWDCKVAGLLRPAGIRHLKITDIRGSSKGVVKHLVELPADQAKRIPLGICAATPGDSHQKISTSWIESEGCRVCNTILSHGTFLVSGRWITESTVMYSFIAPSFTAYRRIVSALERGGFKVKVLQVGKFESRMEVLTEKQQRILWIALQTGYFDYPKRIDSEALSRKLGITPSTLTEIIRRGTRRLLEDFFK